MRQSMGEYRSGSSVSGLEASREPGAVQLTAGPGAGAGASLTGEGAIHAIMRCVGVVWIGFGFGSGAYVGLFWFESWCGEVKRGGHPRDHEVPWFGLDREWKRGRWRRMGIAPVYDGDTDGTKARGGGLAGVGLSETPLPFISIH
jgi:hypothetical protein